MLRTKGCSTLLERSIEPRVAANGGRSGFRLLANGLDAFEARAVLIQLAERTLDLQYYIFHADETGSLILDRLIAAADRGEQLHETNYARALAGSALATELQTNTLHLDWADSKVMADPPDKVTKPVGTRSDRYLGGQISPYVRAVRSDLLVVSPYFVPRKEGVAFFGELRRSGVDVRVLTNSLAATDVWLVHAGYMKYRRPLLDEGVRLYELRPEAAGAGPGKPRARAVVGSSRASLHGKTFVFDRTSVFIGSVNLDPRSLELNTEVGVLIHSEKLAGQVAELFAHWSSPALASEVTRGSNGALQWTGGYHDEPNAGFWRVLGAKVFSHLPIDSLI